MQWTVAKLVEATQGELLQGAAAGPVGAIGTDTRTIQARDCFVALPGENHDGHDFIPQATAKHVSAVVLARLDADHDIPADTAVIKTPDTLYALGELARYLRRQYAIPVVGITGSNGKTSTKEMVAAIFGVTQSVLKNTGNLNNLIGTPLTLLAMDESHQAAVIEMGINVFGEMQRLVEITRPTVGLVTNIHPAHLQGLQTPEHILAEKGKLLEGLAQGQLAVINHDDPRLRSLAANLKARTLHYSMCDSGVAVHLAGPVEFDGSASVFPINLEGRRLVIRTSILGAHQVQNAVAAAAVAHGMGYSAENIIEGLSRHRAVHQRMELRQLANGDILVDDTYNANPMSMLAAVRATLEASRQRPVIAVLGEMRELGPESRKLHREVGRQIGGLGIARLITLGEFAAAIGEGAQETGMAEPSCHHAQNHDEIVALLKSRPVKNSWILVKGSRGMTMERVVKGLLNG